MRISNDGIIWSGWESIVTTHSRTVPGSRGTKTVYIQASNSDESSKNTARDTITLIPTPLTWTGATPVNGSTVTGDAANIELNIDYITGIDFSRKRDGTNFAIKDS